MTAPLVWLASVQTPADAAPTPLWLYALGALIGAAAFAAPWLLALYLGSSFHRRRMARVRRLDSTLRRTP